ncbi:DUF6644 family protein [Pelomicrobium sp. G1]|uniref:DUF6644 family protein n=1 Tax=unclassified Pelomicrobium TaxID=2815318 RepID=UPI000ABC5FFC
MAPEEAVLPLALVEALPIARAMRESLWLYPIVEVVHLLGLAVLVGGVVLFDLRVLGVSKRLPVGALACHLLPWSLAALLLIVPSGLLMFSAHASEFIANRVFLLKMSLLMAAGINALMFHLGPFRQAAAWDTDVPAPGLARLHAGASILIWIAIVACGRLLAYT